MTGLVAQPVNPATGWTRLRSGAGRWATKLSILSKPMGIPGCGGRGVQGAGRSGGTSLGFPPFLRLGRRGTGDAPIGGHLGRGTVCCCFADAGFNNEIIHLNNIARWAAK